jgi:hypothetical protein
MSTPTPPNASDAIDPSDAKGLAPTVSRIGRALLGSGIATVLALLLYRMLSAIALTFANKPVTSDNVAVINLSAAVRTLVMGIVALGTGVFGIAALGLLLLAMQMLLQRLKLRPSASDNEGA